MAEGTYEYECMRAELLGVEKPDYDEFLKKQRENVGNISEEQIDVENLKVRMHASSILKQNTNCWCILFVKRKQIYTMKVIKVYPDVWTNCIAFCQKRKRESMDLRLEDAVLCGICNRK